MLQVRNQWLRCMILVGFALGTLAISPLLLLAPQALLVVFACAGHETPLFQRKGVDEAVRYWPKRGGSPQRRRK